MTIKQMILGTALGAVAVGILLHRLPKEMGPSKAQAKVATTTKAGVHKVEHRVAYSRTHRKPGRRKGDAETQLSSRRLY